MISGQHAEGTKQHEVGLVLFPVDDVRSAQFILCGVVTITIAINGNLAGKALLYLGITKAKMTTDDEIIFHYVHKRIKFSAINTQEYLQELLPPHDHDLVNEMCSILHERERHTRIYGPPPTPVMVDDHSFDQTDTTTAQEREKEKEREILESVYSTPEPKYLSKLKHRNHFNHHNKNQSYDSHHSSNNAFRNRTYSMKLNSAKYNFENINNNISFYQGRIRDVDSEVDPHLLIKFRNVFLDVMR